MTFFRSLGLAALLFSSAVAVTAQSPSDETVAKVGDRVLTVADLEALLAGQLAQIDRQRRLLLDQGVKPLIDQTLLEMEAESRGLELEAFLTQELEARTAEVTDEEATAWFEANKSRLRGNPELDQLLPQVKTFLSQQKSFDARAGLLDELQAKYEVDIVMEPMREDLALDDATLKGPEEAPITIVEFSDFQCPACKSFNPILDETMAKYGDKIRVAFRQFPLRSIHPQAQKAAEASLCARDQGKFWELHDLMFGDQRSLQVDGLKQMARAAEIADPEAFDQCLDAGTYAAMVQSDLDRGEKIGVSGTPAVYVNGRVVSPGKVPSLEQLSVVIDEELMRSGN